MQQNQRKNLLLPPLIVSKTKCFLQLGVCTPVSKFLEATIRGAMGYALKSKLCTLKKDNCANCLLRGSCSYATFFEPVPPQDSVLQRNMLQSVRSWMFNAAQFNDKIQLEITLVGDAQSFLGYIVKTLEEIGAKGLGKSCVKYNVCAVSPSVQYDLSKVSARQSTGATLDFISPVTLRSEGKFMRNWDSRLFFATLLRRITNLSTIHGYSVSNDSAKLLLEQVKDLRVSSFLVPVLQDRTSTRQKRVINYGGLIGDVHFDGLTPELNLLLQAGEILAVGKNTVFGYGRYHIAW